jgi:hypothetical protein
MSTLTDWRKASHSSGTNLDNCVEARATAEPFQVRGSKLSEASPVFDLPGTDFAGFLRAAR